MEVKLFFFVPLKIIQLLEKVPWILNNTFFFVTSRIYFITFPLSLPYSKIMPQRKGRGSEEGKKYRCPWQPGADGAASSEASSKLQSPESL